MYFSRIKLSHTAKEDMEFWSRTKNQISLYILFSKLFFGENRSENRSENSFIFRQEFGSCYPSFFSVSEYLPEDDSGNWKISSDEYNPLVKCGEEFNFSLRFCPLIMKRESGILLRYDCISDALENMRKSIIPASEMTEKSEIIKMAALNWILAKSDSNGFIPDKNKFIADGFTEHKFEISSGKTLFYNTIETSGKLKVTDKEKFEKALFKGIGDYRDLGCGMILIKDFIYEK
ncbi:MAG: type I-E CRISPR-associated protein Cas6/Cse3/CasE [Methanomicrobium sp.]|nr:type I-E CRISPR-associated protein Cas6/Cse3/CasE [Methanomicrobium sp.]